MEQQEATEQVTHPTSAVREQKATRSHPVSKLDAMRDEIFNLIPGMVNRRWGAIVATDPPSVIPGVNCGSFNEMLADEVTFTPSH